MKTKGNGGYQIIDFEFNAPETLDVEFFKKLIMKGKPLWINNLVVDDELYQGVASAHWTATAIILVLATITISIALEDGAVTYGESGGGGETIIFDTLNDLDEYLEQNELSGITTLVTETQSDDITEAGITYASGGNINFVGGSTITNFDYLDDSITLIAYNTKLGLIVVVGAHGK